ncbi:unnamed protein product [Rhizophagus irregularis]|nr:unnamed protein product [Rhizophagus irregularis]
MTKKRKYEKITPQEKESRFQTNSRKNLNRNKEVISITKVNQIQRVKSWNRFVNNLVPTVSNTEVKIQFKERLTHVLETFGQKVSNKKSFGVKAENANL